MYKASYYSSDEVKGESRGWGVGRIKRPVSIPFVIKAMTCFLRTFSLHSASHYRFSEWNSKGQICFDYLRESKIQIGLF